MQALDSKYLKRAQAIAEAIQQSDLLTQYLEEEEEEQYQALRNAFEPAIAELYAEVAQHHPLQLISLERELMTEAYEGIFLPRLLGFAVLRGEIDPTTVKYTRPQEHLKEVLQAIVQSPNFDILKKRIGQSIQMGFALSSVIWVTNLINSFENLKVRKYLESQRLDRYRDLRARRLGLYRYQKQFKSANYHTANFPHSANELKVLASSLKNFLRHRIQLENADNSSLIQPLIEFAESQELQGTPEHLHVFMLFLFFFEYDEKTAQRLKNTLNKLRREMPKFEEEWFRYLLQLYNNGPSPQFEQDQRILNMLDPDIPDELPAFYTLLLKLHEYGYADELFKKELQEFYDQHEGLSLISENLRKAVLKYFQKEIENLEPQEYSQFFEISKQFSPYMEIFVNQRFNQELGNLSMGFVKKCLKAFTDKRSKDYQDIKKFVTAQFEEWGFLSKKQIVELFKTPRKRRSTAK